jgi:hypothetical protein
VLHTHLAEQRFDNLVDKSDFIHMSLFLLLTSVIDVAPAWSGMDEAIGKGVLFIPELSD